MCQYRKSRRIIRSLRRQSPADSIVSITPYSHRRRQSILAIRDTWSLQGSIRLLFRSDKDLGPRFKVAPVASDVGDDRGVGGYKNLLFSILVLDGKHLSINPGDSLLNIGIGHFALRLEVPVIVTFACSPHRFREDVHLDSLLAASGCVVPVEPTNMPGL